MLSSISYHSIIGMLLLLNCTILLFLRFGELDEEGIIMLQDYKRMKRV